MRIRLVPWIVGFLAIGSQLVGADAIVLIHPAYMNIGRSYKAESAGVTAKASTSVSNWGATITGYFGDEFGFLISAGIYFPTYAIVKAGGVTVKGDVDDGGFALASDVGAGWYMGDPESPLSFMLGGSVHANILSLFAPEGSAGVELEDAVTGVLGFSAQASPMYAVSEKMTINATLRVSYDLFEFLMEPEPLAGSVQPDYSGAFSWSVSAGIGIRI